MKAGFTAPKKGISPGVAWEMSEREGEYKGQCVLDWEDIYPTIPGMAAQATRLMEWQPASGLSGVWAAAESFLFSVNSTEVADSMLEVTEDISLAT